MMSHVTKFIRAAFSITLFQVVVIVSFSALKYAFILYDLKEQAQRTSMWICFAAGMLFLITLSITGIIEKRGESYEQFKVRVEKTKTEKVLTKAVEIGFMISTCLIYGFFLYLFAPTTWLLLLAIFAAIFIGNIIRFFTEKGEYIDNELN